MLKTIHGNFVAFVEEIVRPNHQRESSTKVFYLKNGIVRFGEQFNVKRAMLAMFLAHLQAHAFVYAVCAAS